jgi:hypothetical protein
MDPRRNAPNGAPPAAERTAASGGAPSASSSDESKPAADAALYQEFLKWQQLRR